MSDYKCGFNNVLNRTCGRPATSLVEWVHRLIGADYGGSNHSGPAVMDMHGAMATCALHGGILITELTLDCNINLVRYEVSLLS